MILKVRVQDHVRSIIDPDGAVLLDLKKGKYYSLNGVGAEIWQKLEAGLPVTEIESHIGGLYAAPADAVRVDVATFIDHLRSKQLVDVAP